jgi:hypothetical protein
LIMHVYQMRSSNQSIVLATQKRLTACMNALKDVSKVWLVAKMVHTLFESILGNKVLEERLQKAAGRRHQKGKHSFVNGKNKDAATTSGNADSSDAHKRKFDDMEMGYSNGPPAPQMSYERSRPQSPAMTPSRDLPGQNGQSQQLPQISATSPPVRQTTDAFMGVSRADTRPTTPFNHLAYPGTPPDFFLHTRGSPKISEDLWQNYQPEQLFPPEHNALFPVQTNSPLDPVLRGPSSHPQQAFQPPSVHTPGSNISHNQQQIQPMNYQQDPAAWAQLNTMQPQQKPEDSWSNPSSAGGPMVPTTLNVGDWFEFFGIPNGGDMNGLNGAANFTNSN